MTDQILIGIAKNINLCVFYSEVDFVQRGNDFCHDSTSVFDGMPQFSRVELHIREQPVKVLLRIIAKCRLHKGIDCFLQKLNVKRTVFNHLDHLAEQELRFNDKAQITQSLFYNGFLVFLISPCVFIADAIVF